MKIPLRILPALLLTLVALPLLADPKEDWEKLPKRNKPSVVNAFLITVPDTPENQQLRAAINQHLGKICQARYEAYVAKNFPAQASLMDMPIWYGGEMVDSGYTFRELWITPTRSRDPASGLKLDPQHWFLVGSAEKFTLHLKMPGEEETVLTFEKDADRLWIVGVREGARVNPRRWQFLAKAVLELGATRPDWEHTDWAFFDSLVAD